MSLHIEFAGQPTAPRLGFSQACDHSAPQLRHSRSPSSSPTRANAPLNDSQTRGVTESDIATRRAGTPGQEASTAHTAREVSGNAEDVELPTASVKRSQTQIRNGATAPHHAEPTPISMLASPANDIAAGAVSSAPSVNEQGNGTVEMKLPMHPELGVRPALSQKQLLDDAMTRQYTVFSLSALEARAPDHSVDEDLPDEYFELTAADVQRDIAAARARQQYNEAGFRTKARREKEAAERACAIGHATIWLFLPYKMVVQVEFAPLDTLAQLAAFVQHRLLVEDFAHRFHLFTTPPKVVISAKDMQATFWQKGMVPGAHVHVGVEHQDLAGTMAVRQPCQTVVYKAFLRSEVLTRQGPPPEKAQRSTHKRSASTNEAATKLAGSEFKPSNSTKVASSGKVPKWLKLGK